LAVSGKIAERFSAALARVSSWTRSCSRMRWSSSQVGVSLREMAFWEAASSSLAAWSRYRERKTSSREDLVTMSSVASAGIGGGGVGALVFCVLGFFEEGIVGLQCMRLDDDSVGSSI